MCNRFRIYSMHYEECPENAYHNHNEEAIRQEIKLGKTTEDLRLDTRCE